MKNRALETGRMRIGFLVNDVATEVDTAATTSLAHAARARGNDVYMLGLGELTYYPDGHVGGMAMRAGDVDAATPGEFLAAVQGKDAVEERVTSDQLDVLWLRYNPSEEVGERAWAHDAGILFGQMAVRRGCIVLNHPDTLASAINKMYFQQFPAAVRPKALITRDMDEIIRFYEDNDRRIILKPLEGYGGANVFLADQDETNLTQMVESIARSGYVIAQEYLPAATEGDTRLFMVNGKPLEVDGKYAAVRRVNRSGGDFRGNLSAGASPEKAEVGPEMLGLAELLRPKLLQDGLFFVGLDVVGDKLVEINAISAGGLYSAGKLEGEDFAAEVIRAIERKVRYRRNFTDRIPNRQLAVME